MRRAALLALLLGVNLTLVVVVDGWSRVAAVCTAIACGSALAGHMSRGEAPGGDKRK